MMEIAPASNERNFVYSIEVKRDWQHRVSYHLPPRLTGAALESLRSYALLAYRLLGCRDIARIDFRLDAEGRPRFIECNPLPGLSRKTGDIVILARDSLPYEKLVQGILTDAMQRAGVVLP
jgi:D-alanine-D-alanine ligase